MAVNRPLAYDKFPRWDILIRRAEITRKARDRPEKPAEAQDRSRKAEDRSGSWGNRTDANRKLRKKPRVEAARPRPKAGDGGTGRQQGPGSPARGNPAPKPGPRQPRPRKGEWSFGTQPFWTKPVLSRPHKTVTESGSAFEVLDSAAQFVAERDAAAGPVVHHHHHRVAFRREAAVRFRVEAVRHAI